MVALRLSDRAIGLVSLFVLARLLIPADFGLVALANSMIALIALMGGFGFETALIQNQRAEKAHFDTVFTFNVLFGLAMAAALAALAKPTAQFYEDDRIVNVVLVLACARLIAAFQNVGLVYFRKDLAFDKEFRFVFFRRVLVTFAVTLPLAFYFRDYRALVVGTLVGSVVGLVLSYYLHPYRPSFGLRAWRELFGFSKWMLATNVVRVVSGRAADFIIGRLAGVGALGIFSLSREIAMLPSSELAAPMNRAVFSGYARLSDDLAALRQGYLKVVSVLSLVVLPAGVGLCLVASPMVHLLLGQKWLEAIPIIRILAVEGVLVVGLSTAHYIYLSIGQPQKLTGVLGMQAVVSIALMLILIPRYGLVGAALARIAASILTAPINLKIVARVLEMPLLNVFIAVRRPLMATAMMSVAVLLLQSAWTSVVTPAALAAHLAASVLLGMCAYALAIFCLWHIAGHPDGAERFILQRVQSLSPKLRRTG